MSTAPEEKLTPLRDAISSKPPYCSGVCALPVDAFSLFFKKDKTPGWIDLSNASQTELELLSQACQPATFGLGEQDVYDENYRKAGKLNASDFATKFGLERSGLTNVIHSELLEGHEDSKEIECELYKLNVYGEKSFFKAHKDTPRGEKMFGSLVVVFPTSHEGGALKLRHNEQEFTFDSGKVLSEQSSPSIAYIAFYSDVEHEVTTVTSGYRVTLTYNLYFATEKHPSMPINPTPLPNEFAFKSALSQLLLDPEFLPQGGNLGFGLQHQYPISRNGSVAELLDCLKGSDAVIRRVCKDLSLDASLKVMYLDKDYQYLVMVDKVIDWSRHGEIHGNITYLLSECHGGKVVKPFGTTLEISEYIGKVGIEEIWWVTKVTEFARAETPYVAYGNEGSLGYLYGDICLVVRVGGVDSRRTT